MSIRIKFERVFPWPLEILFWIIVIGLIIFGISVLFLPI